MSIQTRDKNGRFASDKNKPVSHLIIPDTQVKPGVPLEHFKWAGRFASDVQPDKIIHLGDHWHMDSLSSYETRGSKFFEGKRVLQDIEVGNTALEMFDSALTGNAINVEKVILRGNHEYRLIKAINHDPKLEGLFGYDNFNDIALGWKPKEFLEPVNLDGLVYSHYFQSPGNGRPYSGNIETIIKNIGFSFVAGHQQGLRMTRRELTNGQIHTGIIAGSFYQHNEDYRGPQAVSEWRGIILLTNVKDGNYDIRTISLDQLKREYA